jgi:hypothetical protein
MSSPILLPSNISTNVFVTPTNVESSSSNYVFAVPVNPQATLPHQKRFALITSIILCNKTGSTTIPVNIKLVNGSTTARVLSDALIPSGTAFEVISGNKITLKEGDELYIWHDSPTSNVLDAVVSYTLHDPLTTYDI